MRPPKLFVPRPTTETSRPSAPSALARMPSTLPVAPWAMRQLRLDRAAAPEETEQGQHEHDDEDDPEDAHACTTREPSVQLRPRTTPSFAGTLRVTSTCTM